MPQDRNIWLLNNNNVCYYCTIFVSNILKFLLNSITWFLYIGYNYTNMLMSELTSYIAACRCFRIFELRTGAKSAIRDCLFLSWALSVPLHRLRFVIHVVFLPREAYATHMHSAVYAMAWYSSVHHKPVFYRNGWMDRASFRHRSYYRLTLHCVITEFGYF